VEAIASELSERPFAHVVIAARGSSDYAALYAKYLFGAFNQLQVGLATPSLFTLYRRPPRLRNALVIGISQSGQSPDIVDVLAEARRQGAATLAITNEPDSPLADRAEWVVALGVGAESGVAATKSYTAELAAIAMLSAALADIPSRWTELASVPGAIEQVLSGEEEIRQAAGRYRALERCFVLGRGFNYATAFELSLKLKELAYVIAEPYSTADFQHGPIAVVERGFVILCVAPSGVVLEGVLRLLERLRDELGAELVIISDASEVLALAQTPLRLPMALPEWLSPIASIVPGQLFAYHLACAKGYEPDRPRGLQKITRTR
jgi:glucosamine--fructose-6-phosphate aminotransferase (isomerizing)